MTTPTSPSASDALQKFNVTVEDFKKSAEKHGITRWNIHDCSYCRYKCGYIIQGDTLFYDVGCGCIFNPPEERDWSSLVNHYAMQENPEYIKEMNMFWHFPIIP